MKVAAKFTNFGKEIISELRHSNMDVLLIKGCQKLHCIVDKADEKILMKDHICTCQDCVGGNLLECKIDQGNLFVSDPHISQNSDEKFDIDQFGNDQDIADEQDEHNDGFQQQQENEIFELRGRYLKFVVTVGLML